MSFVFPRKLEILQDIYRVKSLATMDEEGNIELVSADRLTPRFSKGSILELSSATNAKKGLGVYKGTNRKRWVLRPKAYERCIADGVLRVLEY